MLYYSPHPTEPTKTLLKQEATVTVHGVPLSHYMEDILTTRISSNAGNGRAGLEWVISKINSEVCYIGRWFFFFIKSKSFFVDIRSKALPKRFTKVPMKFLHKLVNHLTVWWMNLVQQLNRNCAFSTTSVPNNANETEPSSTESDRKNH